MLRCRLTRLPSTDTPYEGMEFSNWPRYTCVSLFPSSPSTLGRANSPRTLQDHARKGHVEGRKAHGQGWRRSVPQAWGESAWQESCGDEEGSEACAAVASPRVGSSHVIDREDIFRLSLVRAALDVSWLVAFHRRISTELRANVGARGPHAASCTGRMDCSFLLAGIIRSPRLAPFSRLLPRFPTPFLLAELPPKPPNLDPLASPEHRGLC